MSVLQVKELRKTFKRGFIPKPHEVLKGVSFHLPEKSITGFLGANGAGKTTTIKSIFGHIFTSGGEITFFNGLPLSPEVLGRVGYLPERPYFYEYLTGSEFLRFYGQLSLKFKNRDLTERADRLLKRVDLIHAKDKKLRDYSKGMLQKIGLAQALIHDPELVILDEPMSGLDPDGRHYLSEIILETAREGRSVFFSSHLLHDAELLCERIVVLTNGVVSYEGPTFDYVSRIGESCVITFLNQGRKETKKVATNNELQVVLQELLKNGAPIMSVQPDRNLEKAFVQLGLKNG